MNGCGFQCVPCCWPGSRCSSWTSGGFETAVGQQQGGSDRWGLSKVRNHQETFEVQNSNISCIDCVCRFPQIVSVSDHIKASAQTTVLLRTSLTTAFSLCQRFVSGSVSHAQPANNRNCLIGHTVWHQSFLCAMSLSISCPGHLSTWCKCHNMLFGQKSVTNDTFACSLLDAELVQEVLDELHRLMPKSDPKQILLRDPSYISKVERGTKRLGPHPDTMWHVYWL